MRQLLSIFKPNMTALGYALFLAINATAVWGGVFPFLPFSIQSSHAMFWFFFAEASTFAGAFLLSVFGSYALPEHTKRFLVPLASIPYALGWALLIASTYVREATEPLIVISGALLGIGSAGFYMLWQRLFAAKRPGRGTRDLVLGTAYASIIYLALHAVPIAVTSFLIPLVFLPLFGLAIVLSSRSIDVNQPMFEDVPHEHPSVYLRVVADVWRSAVGLGALGLCTGVMRAMAITDPSIGASVNIVSMIASFVVAAVVLLLWARRSISINVPLAYRRIFPVVIVAFFLVPLIPHQTIIWLAGLMYALHSAAILLMMIQCAQISRDRGINPVFIYGLFGGIMYALHDLGFIMGSATSVLAFPGLSSPAMMALATVSTLSILTLVSAPSPQGATLRADGNSVELLYQSSIPNEERLQLAEEAVEEDERQEQQRQHQEQAALQETSRMHAAPEEPTPTTTALYQDKLSKQVQLLRVDYGLSAREAEVTELLARGQTVAHIADTLYVSQNTVRTHCKRIYAKLDVHKKQQLRDLVESYDPSAVA